VLYPLIWLEVVLPYPFGITVVTLLKWWIAGLGTYIFARGSLRLATASVRDLCAIARNCGGVGWLLLPPVLIWIMSLLFRRSGWPPEQTQWVMFWLDVALLLGDWAFRSLHHEAVLHRALL
jgi:hypothetical protein